MQHFDIQFKYKRHEQSKDTNGTLKTYTIMDDNLILSVHNWGFKAADDYEKKAKIKTEDLHGITRFITKNSLDKNKSKKINDRKERRRFITFTYTLICNFDDKTVMEVETNNTAVSYKYLQSMEQFEFILKTKFLE